MLCINSDSFNFSASCEPDHVFVYTVFALYTQVLIANNQSDGGGERGRAVTSLDFSAQDCGFEIT